MLRRFLCTPSLSAATAAAASTTSLRNNLSSSSASSSLPATTTSSTCRSAVISAVMNVAAASSSSSSSATTTTTTTTTKKVQAHPQARAAATVQVAADDDTSAGIDSHVPRNRLDDSGDDSSSSSLTGGTDGNLTGEAADFLNQFEYAAPELGLKLSPPDMSVDLLEYQKEGVGWMARREHFFSGGIMADFLGMGKTVQMLALCLARQTRAQKVDEAIESQQRKVIEKIGFAHGEPFRLQTVITQLLQIPVVMNVSKITQPARDLLTLQRELNQLLFEQRQQQQRQQQQQQQQQQQPEGTTGAAGNDKKQLAAISKEVDTWMSFAGRYYASWEKRARQFLAQRADDDTDISEIDTPELRTLIIVPAALMFQWKSEIEAKIDPSRGITTFVYHGRNCGTTKNKKTEEKSAIDLENFDFVITTYETVVRGARDGFLKGHASRARGMGRRTGRSALDGGRAGGGGGGGAGDEYGVFGAGGGAGGGGGGGGAHGGSGSHSEAMGASIFNRAAASPLYRVRWKRIILDEAHVCRNDKTMRYKCIRQLLGLKRWAVTATPLHNSIQDLQTLLSFVGQPRLPIFEANENALLKDPVLQRAIARSLQPAFLRRTPVMSRRGQEETLLVLPSKEDQVVRGDLTESEIERYNSALTSRQQVLSMMKEKSFIHVFAMMTLLRQACCHPWMTEGKKLSSTFQLCFLCNTEQFSPLVTRCGHAFCRDCLHMAFRSSSGGEAAIRIPCPACEVPVPFSIFTSNPKPSSTENIRQMKRKKWVSSSKVDMLIDAVRTIATNAPGDKIVIFAQFTTLLDVVSVALEHYFPPQQQHQMRYVRIDGSLALRNRAHLIDSFTNDDDVRIMLASKMATGVGLNLTAANHVIILDSWWNPQVEEQAVHRCHRIGQKKHVSVQRFIMNDTIEQYCYEISRKKKDFGDAVLKAATETEDAGRDDYASTARRVADMVSKKLKPISGSIVGQ